MTDQLIQAVKDGLTDVERRLSDKYDSQIIALGQKMQIAPDSAGPGYKANPLDKAVSDSAIVAMRNGSAKHARVQVGGSVKLLTKSVIVGDAAGVGEEAFAVPANRYQGIGNDPRQPLSLLDFLPSLKVTSGSFEFNKLTGYTNAAGYQATQGDSKPEGAFPTDLVSVSIATIAHWIPASVQVLDDVPALKLQLASLLNYGVRQKLESELIVGAGGTGQISGLTDSGNFTAYTGTAGDSLATAVSKAEATMLQAGWRPGVIVVHPNTWRDARNERESGGGAYIAGSWRDPAPPSVWGIPVITNAAVPDGFLLMLDPSQVAVLDRQQASVEIGRIHDQFTRNVVSLLAELRAGLAVFSPSAVMYGDISP